MPLSLNSELSWSDDFIRNSQRTRTIPLHGGDRRVGWRRFRRHQSFAGRAAGVVLSGSLDDGSRGLAAIAHAGGATMVLTKEGVAEHGMPENAATYGSSIDMLGSATTIAREIVRRLGQVA